MNLREYFFVDFAKAFDVNDHDLLLRKLTPYWLSNDTLHLISSFCQIENSFFV